MVTVRLEAPGDAAGVRETNEAAFGTPLEARLVDALRGSEGSLSLVAAIADRVVGHILFTPVSLDPPGGIRMAGLAPMSVRPEHQRQGVGAALVHAGLEACRLHGYSAVVVVGHPGYYPRFGFAPARSWGLECEFPVPADAFMVVELEPGVLGGRVSVVRYRPEFSAA